MYFLPSRDTVSCSKAASAWWSFSGIRNPSHRKQSNPKLKLTARPWRNGGYNILDSRLQDSHVITRMALYCILKVIPEVLPVLTLLSMNLMPNTIEANIYYSGTGRLAKTLGPVMRDLSNAWNANDNGDGKTALVTFRELRVLWANPSASPREFELNLLFHMSKTLLLYHPYSVKKHR